MPAPSGEQEGEQDADECEDQNAKPPEAGGTPAQSETPEPAEHPDAPAPSESSAPPEGPEPAGQTNAPASSEAPAPVGLPRPSSPAVKPPRPKKADEAEVAGVESGTPVSGAVACRASEGGYPLQEGCGAGGGGEAAASGPGAGAGVLGLGPGPVAGAGGGVGGSGLVPVPEVRPPSVVPPQKPVALPPPVGPPGGGGTTLLVPAGVEPGDALDWAIVMGIGVTAGMALLWGAACAGLWRRRIELARAGGRPGGLSRG
ncbi:hypothetical protein [Spirillospora albida]|uniref:hypothetical protein n=1 Tax=Spirillospora albida TaxID=58123 RepID=UPI0004BF1189|nr:hypothetical protein [Spirillospora albida]